VHVVVLRQMGTHEVLVLVGRHDETYRRLGRISVLARLRTAAWRDIEAKAKRIRSSGGVFVVSAGPTYVVADIQGDSQVYRTIVALLFRHRPSVDHRWYRMRWLGPASGLEGARRGTTHVPWLVRARAWACATSCGESPPKFA
jgi:hypothetical protein